MHAEKAFGLSECCWYEVRFATDAAAFERADIDKFWIVWLPTHGEIKEIDGSTNNLEFWHLRTTCISIMEMHRYFYNTEPLPGDAYNRR